MTKIVSIFLLFFYYFNNMNQLFRHVPSLKYLSCCKTRNMDDLRLIALNIYRYACIDVIDCALSCVYMHDKCVAISYRIVISLISRQHAKQARASAGEWNTLQEHDAEPIIDIDAFWFRLIDPMNYKLGMDVLARYAT